MHMIKTFPVVIIFILLFSAFTLPLLKKRKHVFTLSLVSVGITFLISILMLYFMKDTGHYYISVGPYEAPFGIMFSIGYIEVLMSMLFTGVMLMIIWYSVFTVPKEIKPKFIKVYYVLINVLLAALLGVVYTNDLFNGYVFIELSTLASCGIVIIKLNKETLKATFKYLVMSVLGSGLLLMGIAFLYSVTGHLNMICIHDALMQVQDKDRIIMISLSLILVGLGVKGAMFPLHTWLPDAHGNAMSTSSAILSALVLKAPVVFLINIIYTVYGLEIVRDTAIFKILIYLGIAGMILGSFYAIYQKELKRVIAYSTVAQMGYIFFGIGLGTEFGLRVALFHIFAHALTKAMIFLCVGSMIEQTGYKYMDQFRGIGKEMPITLFAFTLGAFSMVGIPISPGFISKWYFSIASIRADHYIYLIFILGSGLLNAIYYFPIAIDGYFGISNVKNKVYRSKNKPLKEVMPLGLLAFMMILISLYSHALLEFFKAGLIMH